MQPYRVQVARMRGVAVEALAAYPIDVARLRFVSHGENTTFRASGADGDFLVRVHRPNRHGRGVDSAVAIRSELAWLTAIRSETDLHVPEPAPTRDGQATVRAGASESERVCSVLRWMDGRIQCGSPRPVHLRRLGRTMARLHVQAASWRPPEWFTRMRWDHDGFFGGRMEYGGVGSADCWALLPRGIHDGFRRVEARAMTTMVALGDGPGAYGLIHADLHLENALFTGDDVRLIDFDDCGFGHWLYDIAVALWELRGRADYPQFRDAFLAGYRECRPLDAHRLDERLDTFIAIREVAFGLWYAGMAEENPRFRDGFDDTMGGIARSLARLGV